MPDKQRSGRAAPQASGGAAARAKGFGRRLCENVESAMIWEVVVGGGVNDALC